jgi:hypothetical protein
VAVLRRVPDCGVALLRGRLRPACGLRRDKGAASRSAVARTATAVIAGNTAANARWMLSGILVGARGFEPPTPSLPEWSAQANLRLRCKGFLLSAFILWELLWEVFAPDFLIRFLASAATAFDTSSSSTWA